MRKKVPGTLLLTLGLFMLSGFANSALEVNNITSRPDVNQPQVFSLRIHFTALQDLSDWAFGFYMPRPLQQLADINPQLTVQICLEKTPICQPMRFITPAFQPTVYGSGYTNLFAPKTTFPLQAGRSYSLKIEHSNQWAPMTYAALPQSLFVVNGLHSNVPVIHNLPSPTHIYHLGGYNAEAVQQSVRQHQHAVLAASLPMGQVDPQAFAQSNHLVPTPVQISRLPGYLSVPDRLTASTDIPGSSQSLAIFATYLQRLGLNREVQHVLTPSQAFLTIQYTPDTTQFGNSPEGYQLKITPQNITITANTQAGVFYGLITLSQILYHNPKQIPCLMMTDFPRFRYRGLLLDSARHFFSVSEIKQLLDAMAVAKLNTLHWHLTDDEGVRLPLTLPSTLAQERLHERGYAGHFANPPALFGQANLDVTNYKDFQPQGSPLEPNYATADTLYKTYYNSENIHALILYANARQITIIPEIDLPGHAQALVHADRYIFQDLNDHSHYISVQGYTDDVVPVCLFNGDNLFSRTTLSILAQTAQLFAGQTTAYYQQEISVGGDEVAADAWTQDASCQNAWQDLSALSKSQLFFKKLSEYLPAIQFSGWQQSVQQDNGEVISSYAMASSRTAHIWAWNPSTQAGITQAQSLLQHHYPTVLAFADDTYFDLAYTPDAWEPGFSWATAFSDTASALKIALDASLTEQGLKSTERNHLLGVEGTLWSENLYNFRHLSYMALPKMLGLAEAAWSPQITTISLTDKKTDWRSLRFRLTDTSRNAMSYIHAISGMLFNPHALIFSVIKDQAS